MDGRGMSVTFGLESPAYTNDIWGFFSRYVHAAGGRVRVSLAVAAPPAPDPRGGPVPLHAGLLLVRIELRSRASHAQQFGLVSMGRPQSGCRSLRPKRCLPDWRRCAGTFLRCSAITNGGPPFCLFVFRFVKGNVRIRLFQSGLGKTFEHFVVFYLL